MSDISDALERHEHILDGTWASAGEFTQRVCYDLKQGYALIRKTGGQRCDGPGTNIDCDKVIDRVDLKIYDIVASAGSSNNATTWSYTGHKGNTGMFVEPEPYEESGGGGTEPPQPVEKPPYPGDGTFHQMGAVLEQDYLEAGRASLDSQCGVWFGRVCFDYYVTGMTMNQSITVHRKEWRAALGLPA